MKQDHPDFKGSLTALVLYLLEQNGRMYGYEITRKVQELSRGGIVLTEGALYPALHKLEAEGLVTVILEPAGGRLRKYYALSPKGKAETIRLTDEWSNFVTQLKHLVQVKLIPCYAPE